MKPLAYYLEEKGITADQLVAATKLDAKIVKAIIEGNYTASPFQRQKLAETLGVSVQDVSWDHSISVQHLRGNGPQTGRPT